jgi:hypothetical protein
MKRVIFYIYKLKHITIFNLSMQLHKFCDNFIMCKIKNGCVFVFFMMPLVFIMQSDGQMDKALDCD